MKLRTRGVLSVCLWLAACSSGWPTAFASAQDIDPHWTPTASPAPTAASVEDPATPRQPPRARGPWSAALELALTTSSTETNTLWVISPLLTTTYRVHARWTTRIDWGAAFAFDHANNDSEARAGSGNPLLSASYDVINASETQLALWAGATIPLAWLADGLERGFSRSMYAHALSARGLWNPWLWAPEQWGAASGLRWNTALAKDVDLRSEATLGATIPLDDITQDAADAYLQLAAEALLIADHFKLGARVQAVLMTADNDPLQLAVAPFVRSEVGAWTFDARVLVNVDEPLGFLGAGVDAYGLFVSAEVAP